MIFFLNFFTLHASADSTLDFFGVFEAEDDLSSD
jgi:hypothetical protein